VPHAAQFPRRAEDEPLPRRGQGTRRQGRRKPHSTGLKKQSDRDLADFLTTGLTAEGDVPAEAMGEVIRNTTSQLTPSDLNALIAYLRTLPPLPSEKKK